jgi:hypothetical protein
MKRIGEDQGAEAASARSELFASRSTERLDFVTKSFFGFLRAGLPLGQKPVVRRPTREEIALLWSTIPFDLEDPLFVVEIGGHNLIVVVSPKTKTVLWIDDPAGASFGPGKGIVLPLRRAMSRGAERCAAGLR